MNILTSRAGLPILATALLAASAAGAQPVAQQVGPTGTPGTQVAGEANEPPPAAQAAPQATTPATTQTTPAAAPPPAQPPAQPEAQQAAAPVDPAAVQRALWEQRSGRAAMRAKPAASRGPRRPVEPPPPPSAGAPFSVGIRLTAMWNSDPSYDLFADDDVKMRGSVFVAYDLWSIQPDLIAAVELAYGGDEQDGRLLGRFDTNLERQLGTVGVDVRHVLLPWLQPHARLAAGLHYTQTTFSADTGSGAEQDHWAPAGQLGVGLTLRTPTRLFQSSRGRFATVSLGLKIEAGYMAIPSTTVKVADATVADLQQSGPYLEGAAVVRF